MLVQPAPELLNQLKNYQSASDLIRAAIASPTPENENRAWEAVLPIVDKLRDFYEYAAELGKNKCYHLPKWLAEPPSSMVKPADPPFPCLVLELIIFVIFSFFRGLPPPIAQHALLGRCEQESGEVPRSYKVVGRDTGLRL
jgi:CYRIA/CYRIB Rac1 binding domain